jgi:hypothetical protein
MNGDTCSTCTKHISTSEYCNRAFDGARAVQSGLENLAKEQGHELVEDLNENVLDTLRWRLGQIGCSLTKQEIINKI